MHPCINNKRRAYVKIFTGNLNFMVPGVIAVKILVLPSLEISASRRTPVLFVKFEN